MILLTNLKERNKPLLVFVGFLFIGILGLIDYLTGFELAFSIFYVLPISMVTWITSRQLGIAASTVSAITWFAADIASAQPYSSPFIPFWNSIIRFAFFIVITLLLSSLKNALELAHTDHLTSALNSRYFYEILQMEVNRFHRHQRPFTLAYIDLDDFKAINDKYGHIKGDQVLITLAGTISTVIRKSDFIARLGGDEFVILFPESNQEAARAIVAKIQSAFAETMQQKDWSVTFSIGVLTCTADPGMPSELVKMADKLMYLAKAKGKNAVEYSTYAG